MALEDFTSEAAIEDSYAVISGNPVWAITDTTTNTSGEDLNCDFRIKDANGTILATTNYIFSIENSA